MRIGCWSDGWISDGREIKREQAALGELQIVERRQFHEKVMGMLAVGYGIAEGGLALSRLSIARTVTTPRPALRCAIPMNQLVEKNLSAPRALLCCWSTTNTFAWNISIHAPCVVISMGTGVEMGSALVPEPA